MFLIILELLKKLFVDFTQVVIAKCASLEVRPRRGGESRGAPHVDDSLLKPLFLCSERKLEKCSMNAIIDVHETSVGVAFGEQSCKTCAVAAVALTFCLMHMFWQRHRNHTTKTEVVHQTVYFKGLPHIEDRDLGC